MRISLTGTDAEIATALAVLKLQYSQSDLISSQNTNGLTGTLAKYLKVYEIYNLNDCKPNTGNSLSHTAK